MSHKRYPLRLARAAHGIRVQDLRALVRGAWWARRWIASLEAMRLGPRLGRGRQYAMAGQVTDLMLDGPHVEATVQGSRTEAYRIGLDFTAVRDDRVAQALKAEPMLLARLLTDDLPTEVESLFREIADLPLFPRPGPQGKTPEGKTIFDVKMSCSCPDWARPCKHIAAVLLILGEEVARRPATLLALRGVDLDDLVPPGPAQDQGVCAVAGDLPELRGVETDAVENPAPLLRRLGPVPFWRGDARCLDALGRVYRRVRPIALEGARGQSIDLR